MHENLLSFGDAVVDKLTQWEQVFEDFRVVVPTNMEILRGWGCRARNRGGSGLGIRGLELPGRLE